MSLKNEILRRWVQCQNEHERDNVLAEIEAARHEIRIEYLWAHPELRRAISAMENKLTGIMRGSYRIPPVQSLSHQDEKPDGSSQREAPLVGLAGYIAMLLAMQAEFKERQHAELREWGSHACRAHDAMAIRHHHAKPTDGTTTYVTPVDALTVPCPICKVDTGVKCVMVRCVAK